MGGGGTCGVVPRVHYPISALDFQNIYIYIYKTKVNKVLFRANRSKNVSSNVKLYAVPGRGCFKSAKDSARGCCSDGRAALVVVSTVIMLSNECIRTYLYIISAV